MFVISPQKKSCNSDEKENHDPLIYPESAHTKHLLRSCLPTEGKYILTLCGQENSLCKSYLPDKFG